MALSIISCPFWIWKRTVGTNKRDNNARLDETAFEERVTGIEKATVALKEAKVKDEKIIYLLQKYWDLRLSEEKEVLQQ